MKDTLWAGDTLAASCALAVILDPRDVDRAEVLLIGPDQRVIGRFVSPAIGPLPDETSAILMDSDASSACGIGILLQDALILDEEGALHTPFGDERVVIPLGTAGLQLEKFMPYYNDNF